MLGYGSANFNEGRYGIGALVDIQGTSTVYANNVLMRWAGNLDLGSGTSTVYSSGYIAWDSQLVADATWTNQTVS